MRGNTKKKKTATTSSAKIRERLALAERHGLLRGPRTRLVRVLLPEALVAEAKARTGIQSDNDLIEAGLASLAVSDDYVEWLYSQSGTINPDLDLEF